MKQPTQIARLRKKYTRIHKWPDGFAAYMIVTYQGFCVVERTTKKHAEQYRDMLALALHKIIQDEK